MKNTLNETYILNKIPNNMVLTDDESNEFSYGDEIDVKQFPQLKSLCTCENEYNWKKLIDKVVSFDYGFINKVYGIVDSVHNNCIVISNCTDSTSYSKKSIKNLFILEPIKYD